MTRKDFTLIASVLDEVARVETNPDGRNAVERVARTMAGELAVKHSGFDKAKFLSRCGMAVEQGL